VKKIAQIVAQPVFLSTLMHNTVARFFLVQNTKTGKNIPNYHKIYQSVSNGRKIDQMVIKYTKIAHSKTLQNLPKLGFLV
jgi:hypothetical protein